MIIGKVVGRIVSTRKDENLIGCKLMVVEPMKEFQLNFGKIVAVDNVGAGVGENVIIVLGSGARASYENTKIPIDAAIVGIVDDGYEMEQ